MAGVWHPVDLPEGYRTASRGQSCMTLAGGCVEGCPRAAARSGVARSTAVDEVERSDVKADATE